MSNRDGPRHWLGIYLSDHLAGATAGAELARRVCLGIQGKAAGWRAG
jgi:hypothetical protein